MTVKNDENFKVFAGLAGMGAKFSFDQSQPCELSSRPISKEPSASRVSRRRGLTL